MLLKFGQQVTPITIDDNDDHPCQCVAGGKRRSKVVQLKMKSRVLCKRFSAFLSHLSLSCSSEECQAATACESSNDDIHVLKLLAGWYFAPSTSRTGWHLYSAGCWRLGLTTQGSPMSISDEWGHIDSEQMEYKSKHSLRYRATKKNKRRDQDRLCTKLFFIHSIRWLVGIVSESGEILVSDSYELWYNELFQTITACIGYLPNMPINLS